MLYAVSESFAAVQRYLPRCLDPTALARCARIAERIPLGAVSHYLEFRLGSSRQIDFLTCSPHKAIAARFDEQLSPARSRTWRENVAILKEWAGEGSAISKAPFICLEYDAGENFEAGEPEASLVLGLEQDYRSRHWHGLSGSDAGAVALGKAAYRRLLPPGVREACMAVLERCYAALPPRGAIPHAPVMAAREPVTAKPYVILPRASLFEYLERVGWPGSRPALLQLLETYYAPFRESVCLDLTVTDRVGQRLGLATSQFQKLETDFSSLDWWRLPSELAHFKAELRDWVGCSEEHIQGQRVWLRRWLDTKAVLYENEIEYKAYLGFSPSTPPPFG